MSAYVNFEKDLISRTCQIIDDYLGNQDNDYEVTLMTNCLAGLVIVPFERLFNSNETKYWFLSESLFEFINNELPSFRENSPFERIYLEQQNEGDQHPVQIHKSSITVLDFLKGIRNSIAHASIEHENHENEIYKIKFTSETPIQFRSAGYTFFEVEFLATKFISFVKTFISTLNHLNQ